MKNTILLFLLGLPFYINAQFAVINDKDGYVNVRKEPKKGDNITDTLHNGHLIYCFENEGNWTNIDYTHGNDELHGYIYKDRYLPVTTFQKIPVIKQAATNITLAKDSIEIVITKRKFEPTKHKLLYFRDNKNQLERIDNKPYWGTDGTLPKTEYASISVKIGQQIITIPQDALKNLLEPSLFNTAANYDSKTHALYIHSINSDGAGAYLVIWKIIDGIYKERYVAYGF